MIMSIALGIASLLIGASVGLTGVGGFLLVPAMMVFAQSPVPDAVATALIANLGAMILTGSISVRRAAVSWRLFAQLSAASMVTAMALFPLVTTMSESFAKILVAVFLGAMGGLIVFGSPASRAPSRALGAFRPWVVGSLAQLGRSSRASADRPSAFLGSSAGSLRCPSSSERPWSTGSW